MNIQSAVRSALGAALLVATAAASMPALAATVSIANSGPVTVSSNSVSFLRYRNGEPGESNLNIPFTCIASVGGSVTGGTSIAVPANLITISALSFQAGTSQCSAFRLKNAANNLLVSATNPLYVTITGTPTGGVAAGTLAAVQIFEPTFGNCTAVSGRLINATYTNPTGSAPGILTLKGPFYIGKVFALGDAYDDYCYFSTDVPLTVTSPATFGAQPIVTAP